jgi:hypothetical protein
MQRVPLRKLWDYLLTVSYGDKLYGPLLKSLNGACDKRSLVAELKNRKALPRRNYEFR